MTAFVHGDISLVWSLAAFCLCGIAYAEGDVYYQAHRGGVLEVPENTLTAYRHAWKFAGAIPEMDIQTTKDNMFVCMHDATPGRTTDAPEPFRNRPIAEITLAELRQWDAGVRFDPRFRGERVPTFEEVLLEMKGRPERQAYLDLKDIDVGRLMAMLDDAGVRGQVIFVHGDPEYLAELSVRYPGVRTMTWIEGSPDQIERKFEALSAGGFRGISQIQFHLRVAKTKPRIEYVLATDFLRRAVSTARARQVELQLRPFAFDARSLRALIRLGVCWFVTDEPQRFDEALRAAKSGKDNTDGK